MITEPRGSKERGGCHRTVGATASAGGLAADDDAFCTSRRLELPCWLATLRILVEEWPPFFSLPVPSDLESSLWRFLAGGMRDRWEAGGNSVCVCAGRRRRAGEAFLVFLQSGTNSRMFEFENCNDDSILPLRDWNSLNLGGFGRGGKPEKRQMRRREAANAGSSEWWLFGKQRARDNFCGARRGRCQAQTQQRTKNLIDWLPSARRH